MSLFKVWVGDLVLLDVCEASCVCVCVCVCVSVCVFGSVTHLNAKFNPNLPSNPNYYSVRATVERETSRCCRGMYMIVQTRGVDPVVEHGNNNLYHWNRN